MTDWVDRANDQAEAWRESLLARQRQQALRDEARAAALDTPGERACLDCGEAIAPARLEAVPHACRCVRCQTLAEAAWI